MDETRRQLHEQLARSSVFAGLDEEILGQLVEAATSRSYTVGAMVASQGERADEVIVVLHGRLDIFRKISATKRMFLRSLGPGEALGWSLLAGEAHTADLVTGAKLVLARIPGRTIRRLFAEHPELSLRVLAGMGALLGKLSSEIAELRYQSLDERVLKAIARLTKHPGPLKIIQAQLAEVVGATRENTARALARLEAKALIARGRGWVELIRR